MIISDLIRKNIKKGYKLESIFLDECKLSENLMNIFNDRSHVPEDCFRSAVKYFLNGENKPKLIALLNPFVAYGKYLYRKRHPDLVEKTKELRNSFEEFHETYGLRLDTP